MSEHDKDALTHDSACGASIEAQGRGEEVARLTGELSSCRRRLKAVLGLLRHSSNFGLNAMETCDLIANELADALLADAAIFYLIADRGYVPFGASDGFYQAVNATDVADLARTTPGIPPLVARTRALTCLSVLERPSRIDEACIMRDDAGTRFKVRSLLSTSCSSIVGAPVFSEDRVSAVLVFGWHEHHALVDEEREMLQTISETLAFGISSALSQLRLTRSNDLKDALLRVHDLAMKSDSVCSSMVKQVALCVADAMPARVLMVEARDGEAGCTIVPLDTGEDCDMPIQTNMSMDEILGEASGVRAVQHASALGMWIARHTDLNSGFVVPIATKQACEGVRFALLVLRSPLDAPFDFLDEEFLNDVSGEIGRIAFSERIHASEAQIAHALQVGLRNEMPQVNGISTASLYLSATESAVVGGDFFDLHELGEGRFVVVMGDVSGKGVEAAVVASMAKTGLAAYVWEKTEPDEMVSALNSLFLNFSRAETFATMCVVLVDLPSRSAKYCSAGHPPAMLVHAPDSANPSLELLATQSPVVGAFEGMRYISGSFTFELGDVLFLYTDGTTEARSPSGGFFGEGNLRDALLRACRFGLDDIPRRVLKEVEEFSGNDTHDDIAMVAVRFDGLA